jgi:hypothetical protein
MTPDLVLIVWMDQPWRIEPAATGDCLTEGDEYCIATIPVGELLTAIEAAKVQAAIPKPKWE